MDTGSERHGSSLLNLPVELIEGLAEALCLPDLLNFRLACKNTNDVALPYVGEAFFAYRSHLSSDRRSMQCLLEISKHQHLAKYVQHLRLFTMAAAKTHEYECLWNSNSDDPYNRMKRDEISFYKHDVSTLLDSIFSNFNRMGFKLSINLHFYDAPTEHAYYDGKLHLHREPPKFWGFNKINEKCPDIVHNWHMNNLWQEAVLKAIISTQCAPMALEAGCEGMELGVSSLSYKSHKLRSENLRKLHLALDSFDEGEIYGSDLIACPRRRLEVQTFVKVLANAIDLDELSLSHFVDGMRGDHRIDILSEDLFKALANKVYSDGSSIELQNNGPITPALTVLKLENHRIKLYDLLRFCRERRHTLTSVSLQYVKVIRRGYILDDGDVVQLVRDAIGASHDRDLQVGCSTWLPPS